MAMTDQSKDLNGAASKIGISMVGSRTILSPKASLTYQNCTELEAVFSGTVKQHNNEVILDCKSVKFLDSEVLELLVKIQGELKNRGGVLKIIGLDPVCRDIFYATRLINVFNIFKDIHEAIKITP
jgi:anti-anti-sigma factor